ncbi:diacylglycerol/lipid kinase family protein [Nocardioides jiangxiensis]|uniref:YegS/Rv2252/BmrU family lipid kinase n=1 Tax=Nocardioides jiangxiensis TaxID=3064524 RepID=A0ABT9B037_9ACTN|nr:YegS/Rv2252/BmrU family lipid kinase [Nocardioides sp. WY-20]MDO7868090.1 YegS/Rv2252/BmrU family lipid kinase [Nocardioides sp. WY-20]
MSHTLLVNPRAGGATISVAAAARAALEEAGCAVHVALSEEPAATRSAVDEACCRGDVLVAVGGDGTVSSAAGLVAERGGVLGLVPSGRGNDFARMLGIPATARGAVDVLLTGQVEQVDLLAATLPGSGPRIVVGSVYSGVDAHAAELAEAMRWLPAFLQYPVAGVRSLASYTPVEVEVVVDGVAHCFGAATVVVANSAFYGSGMQVAPDASVTDGLLDVVVVSASSRRSLISAMPTIYSGRHVLRDDVAVLRGRVVEVRGTPRVSMGADGEPLGLLPARDDVPARIEVLPSALRMITPA